MIAMEDFQGSFRSCMVTRLRDVHHNQDRQAAGKFDAGRFQGTEEEDQGIDFEQRQQKQGT